MKKLFAACCLIVGAFLVSTVGLVARADTVKLRDGHPQAYVVVKGDTLWDISGRFLSKPWRWPEVWEVNPQIENPHLIYPGDTVYLTWVNGQPRLSLKPGELRLKPRVRITPLEDAIPAIPLKDLSAFLSDNAVLEEELLGTTPYVLGTNDRRTMAGAGDRIYARGEFEEEDIKAAVIYRPESEFIDPTTGELLGYELFKVADASVLAKKEDIITLYVKSSHLEIRPRDRVLPSPEGRIQSVFYPAPAPAESQGTILSVLRGVNKIGRYDGVVISQGARDGVQPGAVYEVFTLGEEIRDPVTGELISLPSEKAGQLMVFKTYNAVSYALVMEATRVLSVGDEVRSTNFVDE